MFLFPPNDTLLYVFVFCAYNGPYRRLFGGMAMVTPLGGATELGEAVLALIGAIWRVVKAVEALART